jgi:8-oxo-dGTP diphosphatase
MKRVRAAALVCKDNKILMIKRKKLFREYYILPGGTVENNESPESAALRELFEETSVTADIAKELHTYTFNSVFNHIFLCTYINGEPKLQDDSEEVRHSNMLNHFTPLWVPLHDLPNITMYSEQTKSVLIKYSSNLE